MEIKKTGILIADQRERRLKMFDPQKPNRIICAFLVGALLLLAFSFAVSAEKKQSCSNSWYCVHVKDHIRPKADASLSFVEDLNGFYLDGRPDEKVIYLTFDAGYENGNVAKVLDALHEEGAPAAFFILQNLIDKNPALVKRMVAEGHLVCNHTVHHRDMSEASDGELMEELHGLEKSFQELTGIEMPKYYRPPEGRFSKENLICASENGYKTIFWSFAYPDWNNAKQMDAQRAKQIILENLHNGEVMLLHPTSKTNAEILPEILLEIKARGYRFGTLDELTSAR